MPEIADSEAMAGVELALAMLGISQKELAVRLGVSPGQISKWKSGEYMSSEMEQRIKELTKIGDLSSSVVLWAGSLQNAKQWDKLFHYLAEMANEGGETGYDAYLLQDELDNLTWHTVHTLNEMGVAPPKAFPRDLALDYGKIDWEEIEIIYENPYVALVNKLYKSYVDVYGFYAAYIDELLNDNTLFEKLSGEGTANIEPCLMELAAAKLAVDRNFAPKFAEFRYKVHNDYRKWLTLLRDEALRAHVPIRAELMDMISDSHDALGHEAEAEALGFNKSRLHPDIYMNELLVGMRVLHQILPEIMKKLDIYNDFKLDRSELHSVNNFYQTLDDVDTNDSDNGNDAPPDQQHTDPSEMKSDVALGAPDASRAAVPKLPKKIRKNGRRNRSNQKDTDKAKDP
jgi:transcriptional regulator with XRE-family HTH domain